MTCPSFRRRSCGTPQAQSRALIPALISSGGVSCGAWLSQSLRPATPNSSKPSNSARERLLLGIAAISLVGEIKGC